MSEKKLTWSEARRERRALKQKLFFIRRLIEGEPLKLNKELRELKEKYENTPGFTKWEDFPEKWDIGDPHNVKKSSATIFNAIDRNNIEKISGESYDKIIRLECKEE